MADTAPPITGTSNVAPGPAKIDGDHLSISDLRELSIAEYDKEHGAPKEKKTEAPAKPKLKPEKKEAPPAEDDDEGDDEDLDDDEEEEEEEEEGKKNGKIATKKAAPAPDGEEKEAKEAKDDEDDEDDAEDEEEEDDEDAEAGSKKSKYLVAKTAEGKTYKVPKDALFDVKINGKIEQLPASEVISKASGVIHVQRESSRLGVEKQQLAQERQTFEKHASVTNENLEMLTAISESGTPEDFAQYYGMLTGKDPTSVLHGMIERAIQYAEQFSQMTDRERHLYSENRKITFQQTLASRAQAQQQSEHARIREQQAVVQKLKTEGLTPEDFHAAHADVQQKIQTGELRRNDYSAMDIAEYAVAFKHDRNVRDAVSKIDDARSTDDAFVAKISRAVIKAEAATGEKFTAKEIRTLVRKAAEFETNGLRESLNRKVDRAKRSGKTASERAHSRNQEQNGAGPLTLREHHEKLYGGY